jgi:hypothetical protein
VIISSNAKGVAPLFSSFEYNAGSNARTMLSWRRRFVKSSLLPKTAEKLSIYREVAPPFGTAIVFWRLKHEHMIIFRARSDSIVGGGGFGNRPGQAE